MLQLCPAGIVRRVEADRGESAGESWPSPLRVHREKKRGGTGRCMRVEEGGPRRSRHPVMVSSRSGKKGVTVRRCEDIERRGGRKKFAGLQRPI